MADDAAARVLHDGELEVLGRMPWSSNATYLCEVRCGEEAVRAIYKPRRGERPLWDFPSGLDHREVAAYELSEALGWGLVPLTILREGPLGTGMVQLWWEPDPSTEAVDLVPVGQVPPGFRRVLDAQDGAGNPVSLVHEDSEPMRR